MRICFIVTALLLVSTVSAGPLGLEMGASLADLRKKLELKQDSQFTYSTSSLPNGHPDFSRYLLLITPEHGLCKVSALNGSISTSAYGEQLRSKFEDLHRALTAKYGEAKKFDYLKSGSIWKDPRDWMMALLKEERTLVAFWGSETSEFVDNVHAVQLKAGALSQERGSIVLSYEFKNTHACLESIKAKRDSSL